MQPFSIKYNRPGANASPAAFFLLSRGKNAGRPSFQAPVNAYVFACAPQDLDRYYWLIWGMWKAKRFHPFLHGTCIQLMYIADLRQAIAKATQVLPDIDRSIVQLQKISAVEIRLKKQLDLINIARQQLLKAV